MAHRFTLDREAFRRLVSGQTLSMTIGESGVLICLADIGFAEMLAIVREVHDEHNGPELMRAGFSGGHHDASIGERFEQLADRIATHADAQGRAIEGLERDVRQVACRLDEVADVLANHNGRHQNHDEATESLTLRVNRLEDAAAADAAAGPIII